MIYTVDINQADIDDSEITNEEDPNLKIVKIDKKLTNKTKSIDKV
jgi:hypothetical protein